MSNAQDSTPDNPENGEPVHFDNRTSNPNSGGDQGLRGDMGVSSERTGPEGSDPSRGPVEDTGVKGGSVSGTDGELDTTPTTSQAPDVSQDDSPPLEAYAEDEQNVDRTVGEPKPADIPDEKSRR